jgi:hypothetical protein
MSTADVFVFCKAGIDVAEWQHMKKLLVNRKMDFEE